MSSSGSASSRIRSARLPTATVPISASAPSTLAASLVAAVIAASGVSPAATRSSSSSSALAPTSECTHRRPRCPVGTLQMNLKGLTVGHAIQSYCGVCLLDRTLQHQFGLAPGIGGNAEREQSVKTVVLEGEITSIRARQELPPLPDLDIEDGPALASFGLTHCPAWIRVALEDLPTPCSWHLTPQAATRA